MFNLTLGKKFPTGLVLGLVLFFGIISIPESANLSRTAILVAAVAALMACWWITEAIPIPVTALLPVVLFPALGVQEMGKVTANYANHLIFLFLGGFLIAASIQHWNLHKRIALRLIQLLGTSPSRIILGFMLASALLSMWVSNTATAMMMLPIGMALITQLVDQPHSNESSPVTAFGTALMLGIAYAASIGGVATLIGTPPNAILAGVAEKQLGISISFFDWFIFAFPLAIVFLFIAWFMLTRILFKPDNDKFLDNPSIITEQLQALGDISTAEKRVLAVFVVTAFSWMVSGFVDFQYIKDSTIAIAAAVMLFIIPAGPGQPKLLTWDSAKSIPWDILILFGGGFALASAFQHSGLTSWIANQLTFLQGMNTLVIIGALTLTVIFLTEITSNTATATIFLPLMVAVADAMQVPPMLLMVPVAIAASYAFMLPVATPPNAIVFSSRQITIRNMAKTGIWFNLVASLLVLVFISLIMPLVWDFNANAPIK